MSIARPPFTLYPVVAARVELITPHMKRITVDGSGLAEFRPGLPAQWLKVFVPVAGDGASLGRAYTVRRFDAVSKALELDFFLHGDTGAVSAWAARAGVGDAFEISATHPRSGFAVDAAVSDYLLLGDETALPAIGAILEALPAHARAAVFVEIADAYEQQVFRTAASVDITWVWRVAGDAHVSGNLVQAALSFEGAAESGVAWIAGESAAVKAIREHALSSWRVDRGRLHAAGYWKQGTGDHRDEDAAG